MSKRFLNGEKKTNRTNDENEILMLCGNPLDVCLLHLDALNRISGVKKCDGYDYHVYYTNNHFEIIELGECGDETCLLFHKCLKCGDGCRNGCECGCNETEDDEETEEEYIEESKENSTENQCFVCKQECSEHSQICGQCARNGF